MKQAGTILDWSSYDVALSDPRHPFHVAHMEMALEEAEAAAEEDEVPVGAVIVSYRLGVIGRAHNQREQLKDPTAHAEMIAITQAAQARAVVASGRLCALRHVGAMPDVCGGHRTSPASARGIRNGRPESRRLRYSLPDHL